ncbi:MAG: hypothetical protein ACREFC_13920 [Stellaceae bacterium]
MKELSGSWLVGVARVPPIKRRATPMNRLSQSLPLSVLALGLAIGWANATPHMPIFQLAEQVADAPSDPTEEGAGQDKATTPKKTPSETLSEHKGVLRPPPTGDHAVIQPPPTEKTNKAVISPPGTPGGNENVQPK